MHELGSRPIYVYLNIDEKCTRKTKLLFLYFEYSLLLMYYRDSGKTFTEIKITTQAKFHLLVVDLMTAEI